MWELPVSLELVLTEREPLGPIDQAYVRSERDSDEILDGGVAPFSEAISKSPILLLGRKGSGKSSILTEFRIRAGSTNPSHLSDSPPTRTQPAIINIRSWNYFHNLTRHVANQYKASTAEMDSELVPTEYLASLWSNALWDEIIRHFYNFCHDRDCRSALAPVERYMLADGRYIGSPHEEAERLFNAARDAILAFINDRKTQINLLIDSMEKYPVRNEIFAEVLGGLLQGINNVHYDSPRVNVTFCLPEEIERHLVSGSANIMKDYAVAYRIRWKPIDLLRVVAHRYRLYAKFHELELFESTRELDFDRRDHLHAFFAALMPAEFYNALGEPEDPLAYVIRHTQLLPRHAIALFNGIITRERQRSGQTAQLSQESIIAGTADAEKIIAQHVLFPFMRIYPGLLSCCEDILPDLSPVCTLSMLNKVQSRFRRRIEADVTNVWKTMFDMGILGRVVHSVETTAEGDRYHFGQFHYNIDGTFGLANADRYCFHPIFTRHFGITRKNGDKLSVYPANVDMVTLR